MNEEKDMNKGTPADPLRDLAQAILAVDIPHGQEAEAAQKMQGLAAAALATKPAETADSSRAMFVARMEEEALWTTREVLGLLNDCDMLAARGHPTESAGKSPDAAGVVEEMFDLLCSVADNLGDMPVSDAWADKTSDRARTLLGKLEPHIITAEWEHAQRHIARLAETQRSSNATRSDETGQEGA